jgi:hypothetical protein
MGPIALLWLGAQLGLRGCEAEAACVDCHNSIEPIASGEMEREILRIGVRYHDSNRCVVCNGGAFLSVDKESAHKGAPA